MKLSWVFGFLGLCVAPAVGQSIATLTLESIKERWDEHPESGECIANWETDVPVGEVNVKGETPGAVCFFFPEADCKGQGTALTEGKYEFNDDFYVSSFGCLEWDRKEP